MCCNCEEASMNYSNGFQTYARPTAGKPCRVGSGRKTSLYGCGINQNHIRNERT